MKKVFAIYGAIAFALVIIVCIPAYYIVFMTMRGIKRDRAGHKISQIAGHLLFFLYGVRVRIINNEYVKSDEVYIFVANHSSLLDVPAVALATPNTFKFLAKYELTKIPLFGYIIKNLYFSVKRTDKDDRARSMDAMKSCLDRGVSLFIFPEGTRNKTDEPLAGFYDGAFKLAMHSKRPLLVCTIIGSKKLLMGTSMQPGTMCCVYSEPFWPGEHDTLETLKDRVRAEMLRNLNAT
jgi:1-acyl-sn-glycerol-3-phosphate acyltransferase